MSAAAMEVLARAVCKARGEAADVQVTPQQPAVLGGYYMLPAHAAPLWAYRQEDVRHVLEALKGLDDDAMEAFARGADAEEAAQRGEPSPWDASKLSSDATPETDAVFREERIAAVREGLKFMVQAITR